MSSPTLSPTVAVIGGGVVGAAVFHALAHRGIDVLLIEAESGLAYAASGTNSGVLHTGFDSAPGELETELILRSAALRPAILEALRVPVLHTGAVLAPHRDEDHETIAALAANAQENGVDVDIRSSDGALLVPGESVTDPVAFTQSLAASGVAAGGRLFSSARVVAIEEAQDALVLRLADGRRITASVAINAAGLYADEIARLVGDDSFEIYPRKGEFFVYRLPGGQTLDHIVLPVPTKRTKGVLVFPTLDGHVATGPTAVDLLDKEDWSVRDEAFAEISAKAVAQFPALAGLTPVAKYSGLRPAGRGSNYIIGAAATCARLINVAAIRSTGLTSSIGIGAYVADLLPALGIEGGEERPVAPLAEPVAATSWWRRTAEARSR